MNDKKELIKKELLRSDLNGYCYVCGHYGVFKRGEIKSLRESYKCEKCGCSQKQRDQASIIIDEFSHGNIYNLEALITSGQLDEVRIYELAYEGPFKRRLGKLKYYTSSYYESSVVIGAVNINSTRNEDIENLTFKNNKFDLIVSTDVMEHVPNYKKGLEETLRVLKPGGVHIFSIPTSFPLQAKTEIRAQVIGDRLIHNKPERYHVSGKGEKCLVYTDFGQDLKKFVHEIGGRLSIVRKGTRPSEVYNSTYLMRKIG